MKALEPGERATQLPWLAPGSEALAALARSGAVDCWNRIKFDPGAVLLLLRQLPDDADALPSEIFAQPAVFDCAQQLLRHGTGFVDWSRPALQPLLHTAIRQAHIAETLARRSASVDPAFAWCGGLLSWLGWFALAAVDSDLVAALLTEASPSTAGNRDSGAASLPSLEKSTARRLARRWHLPALFRSALGYLDLPLTQIVHLGGHEAFTALLQLAGIVNSAHSRLPFPIGGDTDELLGKLNLRSDAIADLPLEIEWPAGLPGKDPHAQTHLTDLLQLAAELRRFEKSAYGPPLETEVDRLQQLLTDQQATERQRLQRLKLKALVEFAAGAGHEINNPLAVISGQSQYLLARETDPTRQNSLRGIIRQTERIHQILTDLMHFAKPPLPAARPFDLRDILVAAVDELRLQVQAKNIRFEWNEWDTPAVVVGDPHMIRSALSHLLRNAFEAAGNDGWIRVTVHVDADIQVVVEDSGPGPKPAIREHLFDPFFSGKSAGRGRGLGLPMAWRFAQENGGDVQYAPISDHPSRFVLQLKRTHLLPEPILRHAPPPLERKSA